MLRGSPHLIITLCCLGNPSPHPLLVLFAIYRCRVNKKFTTNKFGCGGHFSALNGLTPKQFFKMSRKWKKGTMIWRSQVAGCQLAMPCKMRWQIFHPAARVQENIFWLVSSSSWLNVAGRIWNPNFTVAIPITQWVNTVQVMPKLGISCKYNVI